MGGHERNSRPIRGVPRPAGRNLRRSAARPQAIPRRAESVTPRPLSRMGKGGGIGRRCVPRACGVAHGPRAARLVARRRTELGFAVCAPLWGALRKTGCKTSTDGRACETTCARRCGLPGVKGCSLGVCCMADFSGKCAKRMHFREKMRKNPRFPGNAPPSLRRRKPPACGGRPEGPGGFESTAGKQPPPTTPPRAARPPSLAHWRS